MSALEIIQKELNHLRGRIFQQEQTIVTAIVIRTELMTEYDRLAERYRAEWLAEITERNKAERILDNAISHRQ